MSVEGSQWKRERGTESKQEREFERVRCSSLQVFVLLISDRSLCSCLRLSPPQWRAKGRPEGLTAVRIVSTSLLPFLSLQIIFWQKVHFILFFTWVTDVFVEGNWDWAQAWKGDGLKKTNAKKKDKQSLMCMLEKFVCGGISTHVACSYGLCVLVY